MTAPRVESRPLDARAHAGILLRLDVLRAVAAVRRPSAGAWAGAVLPLVLTLLLLGAIGRAAGPEITAPGDAAVLALLLAAPTAYVAYGTLFRSGDATFVRHLGVPARAVYAERALRLLLQASAFAILALVPFVAAGRPVGPPLAVAAGGAFAAWGAAAAVTSLAALGMSGHAGGRSWGLLSAGMWDREVAAAAPLVYAPVVPVISAAAAGAAVGAATGWLAIVLVLAGAGALLGAGWYARAVPRFGAQAQEMAFAPAARGGGRDLRVGGGVASALPRAAAAVWARDSVVVGRRYPWTARIAWPVAIGGMFALARWGHDPVIRTWVAAGVALVLLVQGIAAVGLGRTEAAGGRWLDRSLGIGAKQRLLGRWGWGAGLSLWTTVPISLAWWWWSGLGGAWAWLLAGVLFAGFGAVASALSSGWR